MISVQLQIHGDLLLQYLKYCFTLSQTDSVCTDTDSMSVQLGPSLGRGEIDLFWCAFV